MRTYENMWYSIAHALFMGVKYYRIGIYRYILHQRISEEPCADVCERERGKHTLTLSPAHKRPERRQPRKYAIWKREIVLGKIKHAERRSKRKSVLTLADPRCAGVCVCECASAYVIILLLNVSVCLYQSMNVSVFTSKKQMYPM
jgi:hypothetical protein